MSAEPPLTLPRGGADHKIDDAEQIHAPFYNDSMKQTITTKYRLNDKYRLNVDDPTPLVRMSEVYRDACNFVSKYIFGKGKDNVPAEWIIHDDLYLGLRSRFGLKSQMAQSVIKTVLARYSTLLIRCIITEATFRGGFAI